MSACTKGGAPGEEGLCAGRAGASVLPVCWTWGSLSPHGDSITVEVRSANLNSVALWPKRHSRRPGINLSELNLFTQKRFVKVVRHGSLFSSFRCSLGKVLLATHM
ncbi:hypothetical protein E2C01_081154 [Portunus trituberculatus]|uniref:Uncharacterized protein n=1 Tax=Portunus trituberculatus TaxID=210409 RepID=A0A5B7ILG7_PORTR|nr:hypothetical protein [Portunus trituberculatus]